MIAPSLTILTSGDICTHRICRATSIVELPWEYETISVTSLPETDVHILVESLIQCDHSCCRLDLVPLVQLEATEEGFNHNIGSLGLERRCGSVTKLFPLNHKSNERMFNDGKVSAHWP